MRTFPLIFFLNKGNRRFNNVSQFKYFVCKVSFSSTSRLLSSQSIKTASLVCLAVSDDIQPPCNIKMNAIRLTTAISIKS